MQESIEKTILSNLVKNEEYSRKVIPFIKEEYFSDRVERKTFEIARDFIQKYHFLNLIFHLILQCMLYFFEMSFNCCSSFLPSSSTSLKPAVMTIAP